MGSVTFKIDPITQIEKIKKSARNKAIRISMNAAAAPLKAAIVSAAPVKLGLLKESYRIKNVNYQNKNIWVSIIGPSSSFSRNKKINSRPRKKKKKGLAKLGSLLTKQVRKTLGLKNKRIKQKKLRMAKSTQRRPANYAVLVEMGHGGKHPAPPHPFQEPAFNSNKKVFISILTNRLRRELKNIR